MGVDTVSFVHSLAPARQTLSKGTTSPQIFRPFTAGLEYASPFGTLRLRGAIASMLRDTRAIPCSAEHVLITRGSQMAIELAARALVSPGDVAAVEAYGYQPAWRCDLDHAEPYKPGRARADGPDW